MLLLCKAEERERERERKRERERERKERERKRERACTVYMYRFISNTSLTPKGVNAIKKKINKNNCSNFKASNS